MVVIIVMMGLRVRNLIGDMEEITVMVSPNSDNFNCRHGGIFGVHCLFKRFPLDSILPF